MLHQTPLDFTKPLKQFSLADFGKALEAMVYVTIYFIRGLSLSGLAANSLHLIFLLVKMIFCGLASWCNVDDPAYHMGYLPVSIILAFFPGIDMFFAGVTGKMIAEQSFYQPHFNGTGV
jgi:hypothetical protein